MCILPLLGPRTVVVITFPFMIVNNNNKAERFGNVKTKKRRRER
jgi:hypothetical protein